MEKVTKQLATMKSAALIYNVGARPIKKLELGAMLHNMHVTPGKSYGSLESGISRLIIILNCY